MYNSRGGGGVGAPGGAGAGAGVATRGPALSIDVRGANSRVRPPAGPQQKQSLADPRVNQTQQARDYQAAEDEARAIMEDEGSSGDEVADGLRRDGGQQQHEQHQEDEIMDDEEQEGDAFDSDSMSSSPSIPDDDIDFNLVYALHTFLATVDGQASVVKGDKLHLLDDTNSYWWLVRVIKTQAVGYIPAENIETPFERLARLNKHRNVDLTTVIPADYISGPSSTLAQTRFDGRIPPSQQPHPHESQHPSAKGVLASPSHKDHPRNISPNQYDRPERSHSSKAKTVIFTAPIYYEHSANGDSGDEDDYDEGESGESGESGDEDGDEYEEEDGEGPHEHDGVEHHQRERRRHTAGPDELRGDQVFDDDDEADESEFSDDGLTEDPTGDEATTVVAGPAVGAGRRPEIIQPASTTAQQAQAAQQSVDGRWEDESEEDHAQQQRILYQRQQQQQQQQQQLAQQQLAQQKLAQQQQQQLVPQQRSASVPLVRQPSNELQRRPSDISNGRRPSESSFRSLADDGFDPDAPTKKLTATPPIVRDPTFDINNPYADQPGGLPRPSSPMRVRGVEVVDPKDPRYQKLISDRTPGDQLVARRPSGELYASSSSMETSLTSQDTYAPGSSIQSSVQSYSDEGHRASPLLGVGVGVGAGAAGLTAGKKLKKTGGRESMSNEGVSSAPVAAPDGDKKRKSGGILSGLFRKKDKKKRDEVDQTNRTSEDSVRTDGSLRRQGTLSPVTDRGSSPHPSQEPYASTAPPGTGLVVGLMPSSSSSTASKRESQTGESMFSTDAALRQQEVEAKQALYHQYGVHRAPGDVSNSMIPRSASMQGQTLSPTSGYSPASSNQSGARMRPGSLIGSPSIPGLDVPLLSVLRVFAGDNIDSEATFKTVLLNRSTTSADLVKQSMQRFRLMGSEDRDEYFLTVKELGGDERPLMDDQKPLVIFEALSDVAGGSGFAIPSVKRSSIGSISSISSSLSLNPAITRLGMNDFTDDSAVKFYLNRRVAEEPSMNAQSDTDSISTATGAGGLIPEAVTTTSSPSFRFAVRVLIYAEDLPENVVFDPQSSAIIPKAVLLERQQRASAAEPAPNGTQGEAREKIIFFPRNVNVSEVIEAGVDRFGIVDAVVDGGDEVEDRLSRRRSHNRVKYTLAVLRNGQETRLHASSKILDTYTTPPIFKPYDRTSKEFRRRSVDATLILGAPQDVQASDPIFIIRRAPIRISAGNPRSSLSLSGLSPQAPDEISPLQSQQASPVDPSTQADARRSHERQLAEARLSRDLPSRSSMISSVSGDSVYETPTEERTQELLARAASPQATRQEIIAAQRAVSRANQRAILSAQKNSEQGVDIVVPEQGTIRSSRNESNEGVRYSHIDPDGTETDISELIESEWAASNKEKPSAPGALREGSVSQVTLRQTAPTDDSHHITPKSEPSTSVVSLSPRQGRPSTGTEEEDEEERMAISALRSTPVTIDKGPEGERLRGAASLASLAGRSQADGGDVLQDALGSRPTTSPLFNESLQDRLDRVLARVRDEKATRRSMSPFPSRNGSATPNGRGSPGGSGRTSPYSQPLEGKSSTGGRKSPLGSGGRDSPSIDQIIGQSRGPGPLAGNHGKKASVTSMSSIRSSGTSNTDQPSTPVTGGSNGNSYTPISSVNSNHRAPVVYRDDFGGLDTLLAIVNAKAQCPTPRPREVSADDMFGHSLRGLDVQPEVQGWYANHSKTLDDLDSRLDALLSQVVAI